MILRTHSKDIVDLFDRSREFVVNKVFIKCEDFELRNYCRLFLDSWVENILKMVWLDQVWAFYVNDEVIQQNFPI